MTDKDTSFAKILSEFEKTQGEGKSGKRPSRGDGTKAVNVRRGTIVGLAGDAWLVSYGAKSEGVLSRAQAPQAERGNTFDVVITGRNPEGLVTLRRLTGPRPLDWDDLQGAFQKNAIIPGRVTGQIRGGFTVDIGARAFMPASRSGVRQGAEMEGLVGQDIRCRIIKLDTDEGDIVVDRRVVLEEEAREKRDKLLASLEEGAVVRGTVRSMTDFGAFIDLGGVDGLLHVSDISWSHLGDPRSELTVGEVLDLKVLKVDRDAGKISLGLKQLYPDPWEAAATELQPGDRVRGTVTRLTDFGAFVEVRPGVEGLIHISEMSWTKRVRVPADVLSRGESLEAVVLKVDGPARRLSLGLKQVLGNPWDTIADRYPPGAVVEGKVTRLAKFGAFVELQEGIEGLIHISELSAEKRVDHPSEVIKPGQTIKAVVLSADGEKRRLKLGMKQLEATSLDEYLAEHQPGDRVTGRVMRVAGSEAIIQLGEGVEGLCRFGGMASALEGGALATALAAAWKRPPERASAPESLSEGQLRSFVIRRLDSSAKRIELDVA